MLRKLFPTFTSLNKVLRRNFSPAGKILVATLPFSALGFVYAETPISLLFCATISLLILAGIVCRVLRPSLRIQIRGPEIVQVDQPFDVTIVSRNTSKQPSFDISMTPLISSRNCRYLDDQAFFIERIDSDESVKQKGTLVTNRRGKFAFPKFAVCSNFPLNLVRSNQIVEFSDEVFSVPNYSEIDVLAEADLGSEVEQAILQLKTGSEADELIGSREYEVGVAVRRWDFASWARTGKPYVREFESLQQNVAGVVIDLPDELRKADLFENSLAVLLAVSNKLMQNDVGVGYVECGSSQESDGDLASNLSMSDVCKRVAMASLKSLPQIDIDEWNSPIDILFVIGDANQVERFDEWKFKHPSIQMIALPISNADSRYLEMV